MKVFDEAELSLRMKNQGKYEIAYRWVEAFSSGFSSSPLNYQSTLSGFHITIELFAFLPTSFKLERTDPNQPNPDSIFTVSPASGILLPHKKPTTVQIFCKPKTEVSITEQPVLPCQVWVILNYYWSEARCKVYIDLMVEWENYFLTMLTKFWYDFDLLSLISPTVTNYISFSTAETSSNTIDFNLNEVIKRWWPAN